MNYSGIKEFDVSNGPGIRTSLYVSGCTHHCKECFNEDTWDFDYGASYTLDTEKYLLNCLKDRDGLSLLGGDPFDNIDKELINLIAKVREMYPDKTIWCWTGYTYEEIIKNTTFYDFFCLLDVVVDGRFIASKKDITLKFKGSTNQKVIDVNESIKQNKCIILEKYNM
jgi:anaerobic ribonucleoside-triphosphate reductase activating protein